MKFVVTEIGRRLAGQPDGVLGRYCTLLGIDEAGFGRIRPFFDIYDKEGNKLVGSSVGDNELVRIFKGESYKIFPKAVEYHPFKDAELITMLQGLIQDDVKELDFRYTARGDHFAFSSPSGSEQASDNIRIAHDKYAYFLKFLGRLRDIIVSHGDRLRQWRGLRDAENILVNIGALEYLLGNMKMVPDGSDTIKTSGLASEDLGITVLIDERVAQNLGLQVSSLKTHCHLPGNAAAEFLQVCGLQAYVQEILIVAQLVEYAEKVREIDAAWYGSHPRVLPPDGSGLRFSFSKFHHAYLLREGQGGTPGIDISAAMYRDAGAGEGLMDYLLARGLVAEIVRRENDFRRGRADKLRWAEAVTLDDLVAALDQYPATADTESPLRQSLLGHFANSVSESFGDFSLGETDPETGQCVTVVVLPSPNMAGKSTSLKALGLLLHGALMGRTIAAEKAEMTVPDQIFHNFNVEDDLTHQRSTFKAQLENIKDFLDNATIDSLGLFDELFNGTSSDYQLALAWAFLEVCSERKLRVMISTHNRDLEYYSDPNGYEHIRGAHGRPKGKVQPKGARNAKTVSIGADHKFKYGSERDSEALVIAREVLSPEYDSILLRAETILAHTREARG